MAGGCHRARQPLTGQGGVSSLLPDLDGPGRFARPPREADRARHVRTTATLAMTASIGPTMTVSSGSTEAIADGLKWPRFERAAKRKTSSWTGPVQAVMDFP